MNELIIFFKCNPSQYTEYIRAKYIMLARTFDTVGELYNKGSIAIIGATNKNVAVRKINVHTVQ